MKKSIMELFGLQGIILDRFSVETHVVTLKIRQRRRHAHCPRCGVLCVRIHDERGRRLRHDTMDGKPVYLLLLVRRFNCPKDGTFIEPHPSGVSRRRYTAHFANILLRALKEQSFFAVATQHHIAIPTLVALLAERKRAQEWPSDGDIILNVDEHSFSGRDLKISIGIANHHLLKDILPDDRKETLVHYLRQIPPSVKPRIVEAAIDMKHSYRAALAEVLPGARIVVDPFHVVQELNRKLNELRKIIQEAAPRGKRRMDRFALLKGAETLSEGERMKLRALFSAYEKFPALKGCYVVKERIRAMYRAQTRGAAEKIFRETIAILEQEEIGVLAEIRGMLLRWKEEILNHFDRGTTNAFIEGCHNKIKLIKRQSYGFRNFENYVLKITLAFLPFLFQILPLNT